MKYKSKKQINKIVNDLFNLWYSFFSSPWNFMIVIFDKKKK